MCKSPGLPIRAELKYAYGFTTKLEVSLPDGFDSQSISEIQKFNGQLIRALSRDALDTGFLIEALKRRPDLDGRKLAQGAERVQLARLRDAKTVASSLTTHNDIPVFRFEIVGTPAGVFSSEMVYSVAIFEGEDELISISAWTRSSGLETQKQVFERIFSSVKGIRARGKAPDAGETVGSDSAQGASPTQQPSEGALGEKADSTPKTD